MTQESDVLPCLVFQSSDDSIEPLLRKGKDAVTVAALVQLNDFLCWLERCGMDEAKRSTKVAELYDDIVSAIIRSSEREIAVLLVLNHKHELRFHVSGDQSKMDAIARTVRPGDGFFPAIPFRVWELVQRRCQDARQH